MTREEQMDWLCRLRADLNNGVIFTPWNKEFIEALNDVLEQEPKSEWEHDHAILKAYSDGVQDTLDKIRTEIKAMFPPSGTWMYEEGHEVEHTVCEVLSDVLKIIDEYKAESEG